MVPPAKRGGDNSKPRVYTPHERGDYIRFPFILPVRVGITEGPFLISPRGNGGDQRGGLLLGGLKNNKKTNPLRIGYSHSFRI